MSGGNHYLREIPCYMCGSLIRTTAARSMCPECREETIKERENIRNRRKRKLKPCGYRVISDPDPIAGFSKDCSITIEEHKDMLQMNCYTPGTILKSTKGLLWEVVQTTTIQELRACQT
jgi:hypothetical protein